MGNKSDDIIWSETNNGVNVLPEEQELTTDEWEWISETMLEALLLDSKFYSTLLTWKNRWYDEELQELFSSAKTYLDLVYNSHSTNQKQKHNEMEMLLHKLVWKIWVLSSFFGTNSFDKKRKWRHILGELELDVDMGENCTLVPWCLPNLKKLIDLKIVDKESVILKLGNGVNLQESISFVKTTWTVWEITTWKFNQNDKLEKIEINTGNNCSFPHWASFYPWRRNDIEINCWYGVFFGINTLVWSWANIGNKTSIWWGSQIWNDVSIGSNVIVWQSSTIEDNIEIPDNCLVPNFSKIKEWYKVISYKDYEKNPDQSIWDRNFVIQISDNPEEKKKQLDFINAHYNFIDWFNRHHVVPDNKVFAAVEEVYNFLWDNIGFVPSKTYEYATDITLLENKLWERKIWKEAIDKMNFWADWKSRLTIKAYPKNSQEFLLKDMPVILNSIIRSKQEWTLTHEKKQELLKKVEWLLVRPSVNLETAKNHFFWDCYITWKFKYDEKSIFVNVKSRWDELKPSEKIWDKLIPDETIEVKDSVILWWVIHWWWNKIISNTYLYDVTAHGWVNYKDSEIWELWKRSVLNGSIVCDSVINWNATINWTKVNQSFIEESVSIAWWGWKDGVIIDSATLWKWSCINTWTEIYETKVESGEKIWKYIIKRKKETKQKRNIK
jgi:carbonic anhydrase/acetyltransferase-like protein (isoleucine patch superfamily)